MPNTILTNTTELEIEAEESWPQHIKLYQPFEVEQILLPDNANCLAVQAYLHMCNLKYTVEPRKNAEFMSPSGRVPFIQCGAFLIAEFDNIVTFIGNKGTSLSTDLTSEEKNDMRAYMTLVNNGLANAEQYICWVDPKMVNSVTKKRYGSVYPWPLNHILNWQKQRQVIKKLGVLGLYHKTTEEILEDVKMCFTALSNRLDGKQYFYGSKGPKELDALVFGHLFTILTTPLPENRLAEIVKNHQDLVDLCHRIEKSFFPLRTIVNEPLSKKVNDVRGNTQELGNNSSTNNLTNTKVQTSFFFFPLL